MIGAVHVAEPATADDVRRCVDEILMQRLMLSRTPSLLLLNSARHTMDNEDLENPYGITADKENGAFWLLYDLALSFRKGCAL